MISPQDTVDIITGYIQKLLANKGAFCTCLKSESFTSQILCASHLIFVCVCVNFDNLPWNDTMHQNIFRRNPSIMRNPAWYLAKVPLVGVVKVIFHRQSNKYSYMNYIHKHSGDFFIYFLNPPTFSWSGSELALPFCRVSEVLGDMLCQKTQLNSARTTNIQ